MKKGNAKTRKAVVVVGYAPYNPNYSSITRDRVETALTVFQKGKHDLMLIAGTPEETGK